MRQSGIYKIQSIYKPEKIYIGSAIDMSSRKQKHLSELKLNKHKNGRLQNHVNKYGIDDLVFSVIEPCFPDWLLTREQYYIDTLNPYFNISPTAGNTLGVKYSEEVKKKISLIHKGKAGHRPSPEGIERIRQVNKGRIFSEETKMKMSINWRPKGCEFKKGHKPPEEWGLKQSITKKQKYPNGCHTPEMRKLIGLKNQGRKLSPEHRQRLIECNKNRIYTKEQRQKLSERARGNKNCVGRIISEESKEKNRLSHLGKIASEETKKKLSLVHKGKPFSEEHKKKLSESHKKWFEKNSIKKIA